jgi:biopolymer transport protein ExbD
MAMIAGKKKGVKSDINITPYIDILLVLLIIFMMVAPLKQHDHPVRVPQPAPKVQPKDVKPDQIVVEMERDHTVLLNSQPITLEKLESTLTEVFRRGTVKNMFIRGDSSLPYGDVFVLMDIARRAGVGDIALLEKKTDDTPPVTTAAQK